MNAGNIYASKEITMAAALALSDNIYAVKTNLFLGVDKMIDVAKRTGINANLDEVASLPLGTSEINILDYATGYTTFASGGYQKELYFIEKIEDIDGNVLNEMMTSTTNDAYVDYTTPTALNIASTLTHKYALKTGSTNTDYWIVGYNPDRLMMMWMGYDNNKEVNGNVRNNAKKIWALTIEESLNSINTTWYETPKNVVAIPLDAVTGKTTNNQNKVALYYYVKGTEPGVNKEQYVVKEENFKDD